MGLFRRSQGQESFVDPAASAVPASPAPSAAPASTSASASAPAGLGAPFSLQVEDVFSITGRGVVVVGTVRLGTVRTGDRVEVRGARGAIGCVVTAIESRRRKVSEATVGDQAGLLLSGVNRDQVARGDEVTRVAG